MTKLTNRTLWLKYAGATVFLLIMYHTQFLMSVKVGTFASYVDAATNAFSYFDVKFIQLIWLPYLLILMMGLDHLSTQKIIRYGNQTRVFKHQFAQRLGLTLVFQAIYFLIGLSSMAQYVGNDQFHSFIWILVWQMVVYLLYCLALVELSSLIGSIIRNQVAAILLIMAIQVTINHFTSNLTRTMALVVNIYLNHMNVNVLLTGGRWLLVFILFSLINWQINKEQEYL